MSPLRVVRATGGLGRSVICDISGEMLAAGRRRFERDPDRRQFTFVEGNAEALPFADRSFDAYTIAFGIRNVPRRDLALAEAFRVLKRGGRFLCLEFSDVVLPMLDKAYERFSFDVIPQLGKLVAGDAEPYRYLVESIRRFPKQEAFKAEIEVAGFAAREPTAISPAASPRSIPAGGSESECCGHSPIPCGWRVPASCSPSTATASLPKDRPLPLPVRLALSAARLAGWLLRPFRSRPRLREGEAPLAAALTRLGPTYIKLGQFLATRPDLVGDELARELCGLQDRMPPFGDGEARQRNRAEPRPAARRRLPANSARRSPRHRSPRCTRRGSPTPDGDRDVAVKVLRPDIEERFAADLSSFYFGARTLERIDPAARRLRPVAVIETLERSVELEMDFRLEAAAMSEMAQNIAGDTGFRVPKVDWERTSKEVLTSEWIDGIPIGRRDEIAAAGHDLTRIGEDVIRSFLRHAMRDGFFHADMHQGNLFVDRDGTVVAVDFGIMGRLSPKERRFLAEILLGFITRDYTRAAAAHFAAGYVPPQHTVEVFAQALRAIGEPLLGRPAEEISMGHLLSQLFQYTDVFDMQTRPELLLLQKTMVVVEGVARTLDPKLNIWTAAEPVVKEWMSPRARPRRPPRRRPRRRRPARPVRRPAAAAVAEGRARRRRSRRHGAWRLPPRRRHDCPHRRRTAPPRSLVAAGAVAGSAALVVVAVVMLVR